MSAHTSWNTSYRFGVGKGYEPGISYLGKSMGEGKA